MANFEGHEKRQCGEHRTTGSRAWCFDCSEWCYQWGPCKGCEIPMLEAKIERLQAEVDILRIERDDWKDIAKRWTQGGKIAPHCNAQLGDMECGVSVERWGDHCEKH